MKPNKANDFHDVAQKLNVNQFWHAVTCGVAVVKYRYSGRKVCHEKMWTNVPCTATWVLWSSYTNFLGLYPILIGSDVYLIALIFFHARSTQLLALG